MILSSAIVISFSTWLGGKIADKGFDKLYKQITDENDLDKKFKVAIEFVGKKMQSKYPDILGNSISYFFTKPEVFDELGKLLFIDQNINLEIIDQSFDSSTLPKGFILEFIDLLKKRLVREPIFNQLLSDKKLFIAVKGLSKGIEEISNNSSLSLKEIIEIRRVLEKQFRERFNLESFKALYKKNLINNIGKINFIGLGIDPSIKKGKRKELDSIFVKPYFKLSSQFHIDQESKADKESAEISNWHVNRDKIPFRKIFDRDYNFVILGNPGSGKSLLIKSIMLYLANEAKQFNSESILARIPFRIELKNYLSYKKNNGGNILKFLTSTLDDEYGVPNILETNLSSVLTNESSFLFFDGLDEIFNVHDKINIKNDIENFHNLFPNIRSIITSRYIGYNEARLDENKFCVLDILSFNEDQIKEYVSRWYSLEEENVEIRDNEISDFVSKMNKVDSELLANPLLLSLIVILYRNNLKIPDSKLEIYQSCTNTLVDKWDASKNLDIQIDEIILRKKEPILSDLAFWQYETLSSNDTEVTYYKARKTVAESLIKKRVADEDNSEHLAEVFLNYAQKRSIYFDNNFTHKTFLEYYTAYWIYSNIEKKHNIVKRNELIKKYIANPFWSIVLELLLNLIDKDQPDTEILDEIITLNLKEYESLPFLIYIIPSLKNISDELKKMVYFNSIIYLIENLEVSNDENLFFEDLFRRIQKNCSILSHDKLIKETIIGIDQKYWNTNYFVLINEITLFIGRNFDGKDVAFNNIKDSQEYNEALVTNSYLFQIHNFDFDDQTDEIDFISLTVEYLKIFGKKEIFKDHKSFYGTYYLACFFHMYVHHQFKKSNIESLPENISILNENELQTIEMIGYAIDHNYLPQFDIESIQFLFSYLENEKNEINKALALVYLGSCFTTDNIRFGKEKNKIDSFTSSENVSELLNSYIVAKNAEEKVDIIAKHFKIKDSEIKILRNSINLED